MPLNMFLDENGDVVEVCPPVLLWPPAWCVAGLLDVLEKYGTMTRAQVMRPAMGVASNGIVLDRDLAESRGESESSQYPASAAVFTKGSGSYRQRLAAAGCQP